MQMVVEVMRVDMVAQEETWNFTEMLILEAGQGKGAGRGGHSPFGVLVL